MKKLFIYLALIFSMAVICPGQDISSGIKAHWDFESIDNGYVRDNSENNLHLSIRGNPQIVEGVIGNAMFFDGKDDYLEIPMPEELYYDKDSVMTISLWAKPISCVDTDGSGAGCTIGTISFLCSYRYRMTSSIMYLFLNMSGSIFGSSFSKKVDSVNWHLYTTVLFYRNNSYHIQTYLDGCLEDESFFNYGSFNYRYEGFYIAATHHCSFSLNYTRAYIDEVRIYNRALTQLDIAQLYIEGGGEMDPAMEITPKEIDIGDIPCNTDTSFTISFHNAGESVSSVYDIRYSSNKELNISEKKFSVVPGGTKTVKIDYEPEGEGEITDTLLVLTEGPCDSILVPIHIKASIEELNVEIDAIKTGFCKGDTAILKIRNEYEYYEWHREGISNVLGLSREFRTTESGTYYVIVRDENGCEGVSAIIEITFSDMANGLEILNISSARVIEFSNVHFPEMKCKNIEIRNIADESLTLYDAILFENIHFSVPQAQFPIHVPAGETINLQVCFSPQKLGEARDTLAIEDFCNTQYIPLHGICPANTHIGDSRCDVRTELTTSELPEKGVFSASPPVPNPSSGIIEIDYIISKEQNVSLRLTNSMGININPRNISQSEEDYNENIRSVSSIVDISDQPSGIYFINLTNGHDVFVFNVSLCK
jgi:hypothetical protein